LRSKKARDLTRHGLFAFMARRNQMQVLKFGGSSLASVQRFQHVADICRQRLVQTSTAQSKILLVLSAPQGVTNVLLSLTDLAAQGQSYHTIFSTLQQRWQGLLAEAEPQLSVQAAQHLQQWIQAKLQQLGQDLEGCRLLAQCPDVVRARIAGAGEQFSVQLMIALLSATTSSSLRVTALDSSTLLYAEGDVLSAVADIPRTSDAMSTALSTQVADIYVMAGFIAKHNSAPMCLLGRNGSDYSAAVLAAAVRAQRCEIWTDVDGVYSADPRQVKNARLISALSYDEAMELSYFGAKVLHPKTIAPLARFQIPCFIKNTLNPSAAGTFIGHHTGSNLSAQNADTPDVKGISSLEHLALLTLSGPGLKGVVGMAARIFAAMARSQVSVNLITQSSSEFSISFCISQHELEKAQHALQQEFALELQGGLLRPIAVQTQMAIVSLVGDGMRQYRGVAAKFFASLAQARVNVVAIAQDSSERSISAVVEQHSCQNAVKVCHENFFSHVPSIDVFLLGVGVVGRELLAQFQRQQAFLQQRHVKLTVYGIANTQGIRLCQEGIDLADWQAVLAQAPSLCSVAELTAFVQAQHLTNPVLIDCTSSETVAAQYADFMAAGFHVVTPNKKANTGSAQYYQQLRHVAQRHRRRYLYETTVGAGLPVIDTLQGLLNAGDALLAFEGILSGSLSYLFGELDRGVPFSAAVTQARQLGFTEPDPRDDLSGMDVARKVLILAREAGMPLDLNDIDVEPVLPHGFAAQMAVADFMQALPELDGYFDDKVAAAKAQGQVLRYVASIAQGRCSVAIKALPPQHPLALVQHGENALAIHTQYYQPIPLVLRGYGAGAAVTAAGIFGDVMRTLSWQQEV
jgi:aspartokinase/homoserine dehydrogenase 1